MTRFIHPDRQFMLIARPILVLNPSVSFLVALDTKDEVDILEEALGEGGSALMESGLPVQRAVTRGGCPQVRRVMAGAGTSAVARR